MKCFNCECEQDAVFFREAFPCDHCDGENLLEYNICPDCGWMWRSINGEVMGDSQMHMEDMQKFANLFNTDLTEDEQNIMENITEHIKKVEKMDAGDISMGDYVNNCLHCNSTAVDVLDGTYTCTDCHFEWEIVKFE